MKLFVLGLLLTTSLFAAEFPKGPDSNLTPGALCERPDTYRYPERIAYCNRDVDSHLKADVFREYRNLGFGLSIRGDYKIDHLIPLCAGGSNREENLWPQHKTVYEITDDLEALGCEKLSLGKIKQAKLVELILATKKDLSLAPSTRGYLRSL